MLIAGIGGGCDLVPGAEPTHVAVALTYCTAGQMDAPVVLAKGYDEVAQRIKAIAKEHGIPAGENVGPARAPVRETEIGELINDQMVPSGRGGPRRRL